jgi:hypothetical protein
MDTTPEFIDCACVIHGDAYDWTYVERLHSMLSRHLTPTVRLHVYTETSRAVPDTYIKHGLKDWGISGPKRSWWYKMQLFNPEYHSGPLLYFDLDTVIVANIDWIWQNDPSCFWAVQDFKYLWRPGQTVINTSIMWWDTKKFSQVYEEFSKADLKQITKKYHGDQDYVDEIISVRQRRYFAIDRVKSWRWQCLNGGYNFKQRTYFEPNSGTTIPHKTSVLIFHGNPKPKNVQDPVIVEHWR